ncbi:SGNH/GDSL hydrolase family protein [Acinetobacter pittii]
MDEMLDPADIANVKIDLVHIGEGGNEDKVVNPRYGEPFKSLPMVSREGEENFIFATQQIIQAGLMEGFSTEAELLASRPTVVKKYAKANDTKNVWFWNKPVGAADGNYWTSTGLSELEQSINYTDTLVVPTFDTSESPFESLQPYVDSTLKVAGDIHAAGGTSVAVANYTYVLNKVVSGAKIRAICIQSPLVGSKVAVKIFTKGTDRFTLSRTAYTLTTYKTGFNYFVLPVGKVITLGTNEYIGFSTTSANLNYKLVSSASTPYYYNANSATATEVLLANAGSVAEIQIGFFSEPKAALITNYVSNLNNEISQIRSDLYSIDVIGKKDSPDSGANSANSAQWIPDKSVISSGVLSKFSTFAIASGNVEVCVYVKSGTNNFSVRTSRMLSIVAGLNTFNLDIPVSEGEYVGIKTYIAGLTRYTQSSDTSQTFAVYSHNDLNATTGFAGPTNGYIWQFNFEVLSKDKGESIPPKWAGKKWVPFGDSITWQHNRVFGNSHKERGQLAVGYQAATVNAMGCILDNQGDSGKNMPYIYLNRILPYDFSNTYITTITSGANDQRTDIKVGQIAPIGGPFNTGEYAGAMQASIEHVIASNPACKIVLITPIRGWFNVINSPPDVPTTDPTALGVIKREYPDMVKAIGKLYGLPVVDFYDDCGLNDLNKNFYLGDDPAVFDKYLLHATNLFYARMGEILLAVLRNL